MFFPIPKLYYFVTLKCYGIIVGCKINQCDKREVVMTGHVEVKDQTQRLKLYEDQPNSVTIVRPQTQLNNVSTISNFSFR